MFDDCFKIRETEFRLQHNHVFKGETLVHPPSTVVDIIIDGKCVGDIRFYQPPYIGEGYNGCTTNYAEYSWLPLSYNTL